MGMTIFSQADLERYVSTTIPKEVQQDHTVAAVFKVDEQGAGAAAVFTKQTNGGWTLQGEVAVEHTWKGDNKVGGEFILSK